MDARTAARALAAGRLALGIALIVAPTRFTRAWVGPEAAAAPSTRVLARALGIRDAILGAITLHTVDHPEVGPRWLRMCAAADTVDFLATAAARKSLPRSGVIGRSGESGPISASMKPPTIIAAAASGSTARKAPCRSPSTSGSNSSWTRIC